MDFLKDLTLTVCVVSLGCAVLLMLVPDKFRGELRSVLSLAAAVTVCAMLLGADFTEFSADLGDISFYPETSERAELICADLDGRLSAYAEEILKSEGIDFKKVSVRTTIDGQNSISITEVGVELPGYEQTRADEVRALISEKIGPLKINIRCEDG